MNRTVTLQIRIKGKYTQPEYHDTKQTRLKPQDGSYYLLHSGKRYPVGSDPLLALDAKARQEKLYRDIEHGIVPAPEPEKAAKPDNLIAEVGKFLEQQKIFVGNDGYGKAKRTPVNYKLRLGFYLTFCAEEGVTTLRMLSDYDHLVKYVGWLRKRKKKNGQTFGDRYVRKIFETLGTFALAHDITVPNKKVLPNLAPTAATSPRLSILRSAATLCASPRPRLARTPALIARFSWYVVPSKPLPSMHIKLHQSPERRCRNRSPPF